MTGNGVEFGHVRFHLRPVPQADSCDRRIHFCGAAVRRNERNLVGKGSRLGLQGDDFRGRRGGRARFRHYHAEAFLLVRRSGAPVAVGAGGSRPRAMSVGVGLRVAGYVYVPDPAVTLIALQLQAHRGLAGHVRICGLHPDRVVGARRAVAHRVHDLGRDQITARDHLGDERLILGHLAAQLRVMLQVPCLEDVLDGELGRPARSHDHAVGSVQFPFYGLGLRIFHVPRQQLRYDHHVGALRHRDQVVDDAAVAAGHLRDCRGLDDLLRAPFVVVGQRDLHLVFEDVGGVVVHRAVRVPEIAPPVRRDDRMVPHRRHFE